MPLISEIKDYDGAELRIQRLGLEAVYQEVIQSITAFPLLLEETRHANGTRQIRQIIDANFAALGGWMKIASGGIDWTKTLSHGPSIAVEVQISGRSDLLSVDVIHLRDKMKSGGIDVGLIVVPCDSTSRFLTDRTPNMATAKKHVEMAGAADLPIRLISIAHDGPGPAIPKSITNLGRLLG